jgi:hypothetical protein
MKHLLVFSFLAASAFGQIQSAFPGSYQVQNDTGTGPTFQKLAKLSSGKAILSGTADTTSIGVCVQNCTTSGSSIIAFSGIVGVIQDGNTTLDHWVALSTTVAGDIHDIGSTTYPACSGVPVIGQVVQASAGGAGAVAQINVIKDLATPNCVVAQNSQSTAYTTVLSDAGKHIYHPSADTTARTWTIDSNANVPYPIGTTITFVNDTGAGTLTISITSDTMVLAGAGSTGNRTLAANGIATAIKVTSTRWIINGTGLT